VLRDPAHGPTGVLRDPAPEAPTVRLAAGTDDPTVDQRRVTG
jgi:hypothetical protein